jgi:hypothetical protein
MPRRGGKREAAAGGSSGSGRQQRQRQRQARIGETTLGRQSARGATGPRRARAQMASAHPSIAPGSKPRGLAAAA